MYTPVELKNLGTAELTAELQKARKDLFNLRMSSKSKQLKDTHKVTLTKKYIAQILTVLREAQIEEQAKAAEKTEKVVADKVTK